MTRRVQVLAVVALVVVTIAVVERPRAAATLTLTGQLPFAVCNEVVPLAEPTGL